MQFVSPLPIQNEILRVKPCRSWNLSSSLARQVWLALSWLLSFCASDWNGSQTVTNFSTRIAFQNKTVAHNRSTNFSWYMLQIIKFVTFVLVALSMETAILFEILARSNETTQRHVPGDNNPPSWILLIIQEISSLPLPSALFLNFELPRYKTRELYARLHKSRKTPFIFSMSVRPSVRLSAFISAASTVWIFVNLYWGVQGMSIEKVQISLKSDITIGHSTWRRKSLHIVDSSTT